MVSAFELGNIMITMVFFRTLIAQTILIVFLQLVYGVTIAATDVNDQAFSIDENSPNGTVVGTASAFNVDTDGTISYSLSGTAFAISSTGVISVADVDQLDFETTTTFALTLTVSVTDDGGPTAVDTATINIDLNAVSDSAPFGVSDTANVDELNTVVFNVLTNDSDADVPAETLTVSEVNGDAGLVGVPVDLSEDGVVIGAITIRSDGEATFVSTSDTTVELFETTAEYTVSDGVSDDEETVVTISLNPINDNSPTLSAAGAALVTGGIQFSEDKYTSAGLSRVVALNDLFVDLDIQRPIAMMSFLLLTCLSFSLLGFIIGIWAGNFEQLNLVPMLVVTPLVFLGGSFYSISMLPEFWQTVTLFNPVVYLISGFRWAFFGTTDVAIGISLGAIGLFTLACMGFIWWIFKTGWRIRS